MEDCLRVRFKMTVFFYLMIPGIVLIAIFSVALYAQTYLARIDDDDLTRDEQNMLNQYQDLDLAGVIAGLVLGILIFIPCFHKFMKNLVKYWKSCTSLAIIDFLWLD